MRGISLYTAPNHYTLYIIHNTLCTYTVHYSPYLYTYTHTHIYTVRYTRTLYTVHCTLYLFDVSLVVIDFSVRTLYIMRTQLSFQRDLSSRDDCTWVAFLMPTTTKNIKEHKMSTLLFIFICVCVCVFFTTPVLGSLLLGARSMLLLCVVCFKGEVQVPCKSGSTTCVVSSQN